MPDLNDFYAFQSTSGKTGGNGSGSGGMGCGWIVIVIVALMLVFFVADGAGIDAIDGLLGFGLLAFIIARALF